PPAWSSSPASTPGSRAYGMLHPNISGAVRAVFVIDPEQVRAVLSCPMSAGRMIPEILRLVDAPQTSDRDGASRPADRHPGGDVVPGAPKARPELDAGLADET